MVLDLSFLSICLLPLTWECGSDMNRTSRNFSYLIPSLMINHKKWCILCITPIEEILHWKGRGSEEDGENLVIGDFPLPPPSESGICLTKPRRFAHWVSPPSLTRAQTLPSFPPYLSSASELPAVMSMNAHDSVTCSQSNAPLCNTTSLTSIE